MQGKIGETHKSTPKGANRAQKVDEAMKEALAKQLERKTEGEEEEQGEEHDEEGMEEGQEEEERERSVKEAAKSRSSEANQREDTGSDEDDEKEPEGKKRRLAAIGKAYESRYASRAQRMHKEDVSGWRSKMDNLDEEPTGITTEIHSPPRISVQVDGKSTQAGDTFDLTLTDPDDGRAWDLNMPDKAEKA